MIDKNVILIEGVTDNLLSDLDSRDVDLWIRGLPKDPIAQEALVAFMGLPWRQVFSEISAPHLIKALEQQSSSSDPMTRKRGFIQILDSDPTRIELPQRCLPIYLLNGRQDAPREDFQSRLRRMTMLEELRRSVVRHILIISGDEDPIPPDLKDLWSSGFRSYLTFASDLAGATEVVQSWLEQLGSVASASVSRLPAAQVVADILARHAASYPEERLIIRVRDQHGTFRQLDVSEIDEPERPILEQYELIEERHLAFLTPEQLSEEDFVAFFQNPESSWRPYAAGLPWVRDDESKNLLRKVLRRLDVVGPEENCVAYVMSEQGAGGTTIARVLAWECAREGYPVLIAKQLPFIPDALTVANFLNRTHRESESSTEAGVASADGADTVNEDITSTEPSSRRYEVPWVIVFDRVHWEYRDSELRRFRNEMEKHGRPVCLLVVTGPIREMSYYDTSIFKKVAELNHAIDQDEARELGRHLNQFLRLYGKARNEGQWDRFYEDHTVRYLEGISTFWVTLSFWIQGQYDLSESIQQWMYRAFKKEVEEGIIRDAILEIAAMSSERLSMPEGLLPASREEWPTSHLLEDRRTSLGALGLVRISAKGEKYWALVHDILGRFLISALFYDFPAREKLGFGEAKDPEHLRFLLLRRISHKRELGERVYRTAGEEFATSIFKIDPDHGRANFAPFWREALNALDSMEPSLRDTNRVFRHHTAVSRRRIAMLNESIFGVTVTDKIALLTRAIEDITYALMSIEYTPGSETDLNLYNSLANAYLDLADVEAKRGALPEQIANLRRQANNATRRAYEESPTNSFVIETYVKNLLGNARTSPHSAVECCIEALGILFSAISSNEGAYRKAQLGDLADKALDILLEQAPKGAKDVEPASPIDVLTKAWILLSEGVDNLTGSALADVSQENRIRALNALGHPAGQGNMQILRFSYELTCVTYPHEFRRQLEYLEQLQNTDYRAAPQMRLEYGILLYQNNRPTEGDRIFRSLRQAWRESEHFVQVPTRLRWLRDFGGDNVRTVRATVASDRDLRAMARVAEFQSLLVPFRPEEFGIRDVRPGFSFAGHVSFGHNGPFLRPVTARSM
jgi:hypothetical protein